jgi:hypothetical protein
MKAICMQPHGAATALAVADKANRVLDAGIVLIFWKGKTRCCQV